MDHPETTFSPASAPATPGPKGTSTPRDFFLWVGAVIALYASITAVLVLIFEYVNIAYPDPLYSWYSAYNDSIRFGMATLIVMVPTAVVLLRTIRGGISEDPSKATIRIRRWAIALTLFLAASTVVVDLITTINMFLSGELTTRFVLKAGAVLLVAGGVFLHFLADSKGYWAQNPRKADYVGVGFVVAAALTIFAGFAIAGTPSEMRQERLDQQRVEDLRNIQYQIVEYWRTREELPASLGDLNDPLSGYDQAVDPETRLPYEYEMIGTTSFRLCAEFAAPSSAHSPAYSRIPDMNSAFEHEAGPTCFERTIDPEAYPPYPKTIR